MSFNPTAEGNPHVCTPFSCGSNPRSLCCSAPPWDSHQPGKGALIQLLNTDTMLAGD